MIRLEKLRIKCCLLKAIISFHAELDKNCLILMQLVTNYSQTINQLKLPSQLSGFLCQQLKLLSDLPTWCLVFRGTLLMTGVSRVQKCELSKNNNKIKKEVFIRFL